MSGRAYVGCLVLIRDTCVCHRPTLGTRRQCATYLGYPTSVASTDITDTGVMSPHRNLLNCGPAPNRKTTKTRMISVICLKILYLYKILRSLYESLLLANPFRRKYCWVTQKYNRRCKQLVESYLFIFLPAVLRVRFVFISTKASLKRAINSAFINNPFNDLKHVAVNKI